MADVDNPAQRLHDLLARARAHNNSTPLSGWSRAFALQTEDVAEVLRLGVAATDLAQQSRAKVEQFPEDSPLILEHFAGVEQTLQNFGYLLAYNSMAQFLAPYSDLAEYSLRLASSRLHLQRPERTIDEETRTDLLGSLRALIDTITADQDLPADLRDWIVGLLSDIEKSLRQYDITGVWGVEATTDRAIGSIRRSQSRFVRFMNHPAYQGFVGVMMLLQTTLGAAVEIKELTSSTPPPTVVIEKVDVPPQRPALPPGDAPGVKDGN